jgi:hypothetical protein
MGSITRLLTLVVCLGFAGGAFAGFQSTEVFLPAVGRAAGNGAQIYTTVWATNLTGVQETFTFQFLKQNQANNPPSSSFQDTLAPGQTKVYENIIQSKLGLSSAIGAARVVSSGEILVAERIFNQPTGNDLGNTEGFFFAGVPKSFSISAGQSASIQGINQGGTENFRYNFALVETGGAAATANVQVFDGNGTLLGQKAFPLLPFEQLQPNVADVVPGFSSINARITATVTAGTGSVLLAGAQVANESLDASGFEMSFRDELLGGGSGGLTAVAHDGTLLGNGTPSTPLGVNPAAVVTSLNGFHGAVTLAGGSNVTLTPSGNTLTIASSGLVLPFSGATNSPSSGFAVENTDGGKAIEGNASTGAGLFGKSVFNAGVVGTSHSFVGVYGSSDTGDGIRGFTNAPNPAAAVIGDTDNNGFAVYGIVHGLNMGAALGASAPNGGKAGHFYAGDVYIDNNLHVTKQIFAGTKDFEIDHPLDPENKYLVHASLESSEMKNIYDGVARLNESGLAAVVLPAWFEALNGNFRYQLTAIGTPQPGLYVAEEISGNQFTVAGGIPGARVSWQVTGVRKDPWARANPLVVEREKTEAERGFYLHPELFGAAPERQMNWASEPEYMKAMEERSGKVAGPDR